MVLKDNFGILPDIPHNSTSKGKILSKTEKENVINFFESEEISRTCQGVKECINVKMENGEKFLQFNFNKRVALRKFHYGNFTKGISWKEFH